MRVEFLNYWKKKMKIKVACIQINSSSNAQKNIEMLEKMFLSNKITKADLICLPECAAIFTDDRKKLNDYLIKWEKKFLELINSFARKMQSYVLVGSIPHVKRNSKLLNRSVVIGPDGLIIKFYDKINLFDVSLDKKEEYFESKNYDPGKKLSMATLPWGNLGMTICYDLRFPQLYKKLAKKGADFFSIPAAFTYTTGKEHWHSLLRARAIENGCFVFAPAQCGKHDNGRQTFGHSMIIDPWGKIIEEAKNSVGIISANIDLELIRECRNKIPAMTDYKL